MRISQEHARGWFDLSRVARLATADARARPHVVPVTFAIRGDTIATAVDHKPKSTKALKRLRNITENPNVTLLVDRYDDDWSQLWWARADGEAEITEATDHPNLVDALAGKYPQYRDHPPADALIVIHVHRWSGWSASET
jgi:PPOX class probable F420-dependent enzyme